MLPIGFYVYPGAIRAVSINAGTYYQWPDLRRADVGWCADRPVLPEVFHR